MPNLWIQGAKLKKNALRNWVKKVCGKRGFNKEGNIKREILMKIKQGKKIFGVQPSTTTQKRANTALTLKKLTLKQYLKERKTKK